MATKEFIIRPGEELPGNIEAAFVQLLGGELTAKARQSGGKFKVVLTSPWPKPPKIKREKRVVDQQLVNRLKALAEEDTQLENEIAKLSGPEILKVATLLDVPMSKSSKLSSLRAQLHKTLRSEIIWNGIAGRRTPTFDSNVLESARILEEPEEKRGKPVENPQINE
ncbi:MAG: hypothetical protein QOJ45_601 [Verrucomicrobiota bacterium]|jgi:hypothetical protein